MVNETTTQDSEVQADTIDVKSFYLGGFLITAVEAGVVEADALGTLEVDTVEAQKLIIGGQEFPINIWTKETEKIIANLVEERNITQTLLAAERIKSTALVNEAAAATDAATAAAATAATAAPVSKDTTVTTPEDTSLDITLTGTASGGGSFYLGGFLITAVEAGVVEADALGTLKVDIVEAQKLIIGGKEFPINIWTKETEKIIANLVEERNTTQTLLAAERIKSATLVNVTVTPDVTIPVITLLGDASVSLELGTAYTDAGATAVDNIDGDISTSIVTVSDVNTGAVGTYTVTYNVSDAAGNAAAEVTRTVNVVDTTAPVITVLGVNPATVELGATYTDAGASADGSETVTSSGTVDTSTLGQHTITYSATDDSNNTGTATRTVNVTNVNEAPVFTSSATFEVAEDETPIGTVIISDADGDSVTFTVSGTELKITSAGVLTYVSAPNHLSHRTTATVTASDGTNSSTQAIEVLYGYPAPTGGVTIVDTPTGTTPTGNLPTDTPTTETPTTPSTVVDFSADTTMVYKGTTVSFTDASTGSAVSWSWDFGDGTTSSLQNPTHTYDTAGIWDVSLTVNGGDTETKTAYITATTPPTIIEQWDFISKSLVGVNNNNMTFTNWNVAEYSNYPSNHPNNIDTFTVNRAPGYSGSVITVMGLTGGTVKADMTFSSWVLSGSNAYFAIQFRDGFVDGSNSIAQLRLQGNTAGTRVTLDGGIGQITDDNNGQRNSAVGGYVSASAADTTPVTISLTLGLDDGSYLLESSLWFSQYRGQQSGTIAGLSGATIDNFRWIIGGGWVSGTDFVELDNITISTISTGT